MGEGYAAIQRWGGLRLPVVGGGGSLMTQISDSSITQELHLNSSEPYRYTGTPDI